MNRKEKQKVLDASLALQTDIRIIQKQIEEMETLHFERTWRDGNILIGWGSAQLKESESQEKVRISPKDKIFSLSSVTSKVNMEIEESAFRDIGGPVQGRFASNKKKHKKKKKRVRSLLS